MSNPELRNVNEVNGWKVNHPHSGANVVYAIYTLLFAAFPLSFLFIQLIANDPGLDGLDLFNFFIEYIQGMVKGNFTPVPSNVVIASICSMIDPKYQVPAYFMFVGISVLLMIMLFFSLIKIVLAIVHLGKGYLRRPGAVKGLAITELIFTILIDACFLFFYFTFYAATTHYIVIWFVLIPLGIALFFTIFFSAMNGVHFKDTILENDLEVHNNEPVVEHISKVHEVKKTSYEQSSTLPPNLTSIGGHAFAENQNLIVANIPLEVTKIGPSAFANCLNLQVVSIPNTVTEIGFNCFFNCVELERINYGGTKAEWKKIKRGSNWLAKAKTTEVVCLDGPVVVNPYH